MGNASLLWHIIESSNVLFFMFVSTVLSFMSLLNAYVEACAVVNAKH